MLEYDEAKLYRGETKMCKDYTKHWGHKNAWKLCHRAVRNGQSLEFARDHFSDMLELAYKLNKGK